MPPFLAMPWVRTLERYMGDKIQDNYMYTDLGSEYNREVPLILNEYF